MKKLMVCGCSFSAVSLIEQHKNTSWSEILADKLGWELKNIARQGCSNGGIRIQIDEVIRQRPDFAIITPTSYDRIEIPNFSKEKLNITNFSPFEKLIDFVLRPTEYNEDKDDRKSYFKEAGLDNINYGKNHSRLIVETIHSLAGNWYHNYRPNQSVPDYIVEALQKYVNCLYDARWKRQIDEWIIRDGLVQLRKHNIAFLVNPGFSLWNNITEMNASLEGLLEEKYMLDDDEKNPFAAHAKYPPKGVTQENVYGSEDPGYHTNYEGQRFLAFCYYDIIKERWGL